MAAFIRILFFFIFFSVVTGLPGNLLGWLHIHSTLPNGVAQRQRRDWQDSFSIIAHFWQNPPARERRIRSLP
jgi:hypothetical protein